MKRVFLLGVLICMLGAMTTNAQENNSTAKSTSDGKPVVTTLMSKKLAYACRRNPNTWGMALGYCTGAETVGDLKWKLALMDEGDPDLCEKFLVHLFNNNGVRTPGYLTSTAGFTEEEVQLAIRIIQYLEDEEEKMEAIQQESLFAEWTKSGVPQKISPNIHAKIMCNDTISLAPYVDSLNLDEINYSLNVEIDEHGEIQRVGLLGTKNSNPEYLPEVFNRLQLYTKPAKYYFDAISKSIDMATSEVVDIFEERDKIAGNRFYYDPSAIHIVVKYDRKKRQCKIIDHYDNNNLKDKFYEMIGKYGLDEASILEELTSHLEKTSYKGRLLIRFYIYRRKLVVKQRERDVIASFKLTPKAIVKDVEDVGILGLDYEWR